MMRMPFAVLLLVALLSRRVVGGTVPAVSPLGMAAALERRIVSGDGVTLPDAERGIAHVAGTVDLAPGDWPDAFLARTGETVCVAVSPFTGCYEFFDETGEVFWTVVPDVLALVPDPLSPAMRIQIQNRLTAVSGGSVSVVFVDTSELTSGGGEAHCASNLIRKRFQNEN